jgi:hypothetical protein
MSKELRQLAIDVYNGIDVKFENGETGDDMIRNALNKAFGGINLNDGKAVRNALAYNKVDFAIINELIDVAIDLSANDNSEIWNFVDFKSAALGDKNKFTVEGNDLLHVDVITHGTQGVRRQRMLSKELTVETTTKAIKIYEEMVRLAAGRLNWAKFVEKVGKSFDNDRFNAVAQAFNGITASGDYAKAAAGHVFSESDMIDLLTTVENDGNTPKIFGSLQALRNLSMAMAGDEVRSDYYNFGYMGKFNGYDTFRISGKNIPTDKLFVIGSEEKFIKMFDEGDTLTIPHNFTETADKTQELQVERTYGVEVVMAGKVGVYTL